jgi:hypothetical protein
VPLSWNEIKSRALGFSRKWEGETSERAEAQQQKIEAAAQGVLDARAEFSGASLADLYDPLTMPPALVKAHHKLDAAVDAT